MASFSFTRAQWATSLLEAIGNILPREEVLRFVIGWTVEETRPPGARFNLLNTTEPWPGATNYNKVGVKNYRTYNDGIGANAKVLDNGLYPDLFRALRFNDASALGMNGSRSPSAGVRADLSIWVSGRPNRNIDGYLAGIYSNGDKGQQVFTVSDTGGGGGGTVGGGESGKDTASAEIAALLAGIDKAMQVTNPIDGIDVGSVNIVNWPQAVLLVGSSLFKDATAVFFRLVLILIAVFILMRLFFSFGFVQKMENRADSAVQTLASNPELLAAL